MKLAMMFSRSAKSISVAKPLGDASRLTSLMRQGLSTTVDVRIAVALAILLLIASPISAARASEYASSTHFSAPDPSLCGSPIAQDVYYFARSLTIEIERGQELLKTARYRDALNLAMDSERRTLHCEIDANRMGNADADVSLVEGMLIEAKARIALKERRRAIYVLAHAEKLLKSARKHADGDPNSDPSLRSDIASLRKAIAACSKSVSNN